jgi:DNA-binding transcriptional LysR family regulator
MMRNELSDLAAFAAIAQERSFTTAARRLGVSQSALSHSMRGLEKRLGIELLARTSRSVSPTAAGERLLKDLAPALEQIEHSLNDVRKQTVRPAGRVRLIVPRVALSTVLLPKLAAFASEYPEIVLDITTSSDRVDIVAEGFDAGIQIGEFVQRDMIAVRVSDDLKLAVFGSPAYFQTRPIPKIPRDLKEHTCLAFRLNTGVYRWEFEKGRQSLTINPQGPLIIDDSELVVEAALKDMGIGTALEKSVTDLLAQGRLVRVLEDWCPSFPGFYLYYPSRRNRPAALSALIRTLRLPG